MIERLLMFDVMYEMDMVVDGNSILGKFWGSSGLAVMLPDFAQNYRLRNISCIYVSYP